jgi:Integrase zinc binding domain/Integrase core domain
MDSINEKEIPPLDKRMDELNGIVESIQRGYKEDKLFSKILEEPNRYSTFKMRDNLMYSKNFAGEEVLCIPRTMHDRRRLTEIIIDQGHAALGHFGPQKTSEYIRRWYWWPSIGKDITKFCESCGTCQSIKTSNKRPYGLLHSMPIPTEPWKAIAMDFVGPFPLSEGFDYLWVIIDRLTSMVHLIPINTTTKASELSWLYLREIVRLHGIPESLVSDRDSKFTSKFWQEVHRLLGTKLLMSTAFHPETDGASERVIRSITQILRSMIRPDQKDWVKKIPLVEFAINSSISKSTGFAPFELNYGYMPVITNGLKQSTQQVPKGIKDLVDTARNNLMLAHDAIIESRINQTFHANKRRTEEDPFEEGDLVYLSTDKLNLPKGRAHKLLPKFIGPYKIIQGHPEKSTYTIDLPKELKDRRIYPKFHIRRLRKYEPNDDVLFPHRDPKTYYDFGTPDESEWLVDDIVAHRWVGKDKKNLELEVRWNLGDTTWEPIKNCDSLEALDRYLEISGVAKWEELPQRNEDKSRKTARQK